VATVARHRRHAGYYHELARKADRQLRSAGHGQWLEGLDVEAGNLAAAVRWYLANDPRPFPHLFRILWLFWFLHDHMAEARPWVEQLLPAAASLDPQPRAKLMWTAMVTALDVGRRRRGAGRPGAAEAAARRNRGSLPACAMPAGHGVEFAARRRFRRLLQEVSVSLAQLRGQDEPFRTALAVGSLGWGGGGHGPV
jgi:hypothetical protein